MIDDADDESVFATMQVREGRNGRLQLISELKKKITYSTTMSKILLTSALVLMFMFAPLPLNIFILFFWLTGHRPSGYIHSHPKRL